MEKIDQSAKENLISEFKMLGLSAQASKAYLALLSKSNASASLLCKETGIPDSKIYYALSELTKKGMIIVQNGTPNTYKAIHPREAIGNLKQLMSENLSKQLSRADNLAVSLSPIFESVEGKEEIDLAYIIRGQRNIARRMQDLVDSAKKEILVLISEEYLWNRLSSSLAKVDDKIEVKTAIPRKLQNTSQKEKILSKILECQINVVISDMKMLITVSSWENEVAIMTNDKALMTMSMEYYENPKCCKCAHKTVQKTQIGKCRQSKPI